MIKILIFFLIVTQISCLAQEEDKRFKNDEIDITTAKPIDGKTKIDDKSYVEYDDKEVAKDLPKDIPNDSNQVTPKYLDEKVPLNSDGNSGKPVQTDPGFDSKGEEVDEKITKKVEKPLKSEKDIDLGKDHKKVLIKPNEKDFYEKDVPKDGSFDPNDQFGGEDKKREKGYGGEEVPKDLPKDLPKDDKKGYGGEEVPKDLPKDLPKDDKKGYGGEEVPKDLPKDLPKDDKKGYGGEEEYETKPDKEIRPPGHGSQHNQQEGVHDANEVMDNLLKLIKSNYRSDFDQVKLEDFQPFNHGRWGSVKLHSGVVTGLTNAERAGNVVVVDEYEGKKLIISDIAVKDVYADYKLNAKLFHRISLKDRELKLWLQKALLNLKLEVDKSQKKVTVKEINLKTFEGFTVKSGRLFWPFNKLTNAIVKNQEQVIKDLVKNEFEKYMGKVVHNIQFDEVFAKF